MKAYKVLTLCSVVFLLQACSIEIPFSKNAPAITTSNSNSAKTQPIVQTGGLLNVLNTNTNTTPQTTPTPLTANKKIPTRQAQTGCTWKNVEEKELGISFLEEVCSATNNSLPYIVKGNKVVNSDGSADQYPVLTVFYKQGEESNEEVLTRLFLSKLESTMRADCTIKKDSIVSPNSSHERYIITTTESAAKKLAENNEPYFGTCGDFGLNGARTYFEFAKGMKKFLFVEAGQDTPSIDLDSIEITK